MTAKSHNNGWIWLITGCIVGGVGGWSVSQMYFAREPAASAKGDGHGDAEDHHDHIVVSPTARRNLRLKTTVVKTEDFERHVRVPAVLRERPGISDLTVTPRVSGVVTEVYVLPGQALKVGQPLFKIELTGESLVEAQTELLGDLARLRIQEAELERLSGLSGAARKDRIRAQYEKDRLAKERDVHCQELLLRGLTEQQVAGIEKTGQLLRAVTIVMPDALSVAHAERVTLAQGDERSFTDGLNFTIEDLHAHPGKAVKPTDSLCDVAYHTTLYVEGQAFEKDVETIRALCEDNRKVAVSLGPDGNQTQRRLKIVYLDNHVESDEQTFRFYLALTNEVLGDIKQSSGAIFRSWRFKPGQRGHVQIPTDTLQNHFVLPAAAVVMEGVDAFVFRKEEQVHEDAGDHEHAAGDVFEPVPVHLVYRDETHAVVAPGDDLKVGDRIARNCAYQLHVALKADSGGGHAHDHDH